MKSTPSGYATSFWHFFFMHIDCAWGIVARTSLRAYSFYMVTLKCTRLRLPPRGIPTLPMNGLVFEVPLILVFIYVLVSKKRRILGSPSSMVDLSILRISSSFLSMESNAADLSVPGI